MLFNSAIFIFAFLPVTLLVFYGLRSRGWIESAFAWLLIASLFFYGWWNPVYLVLIALSIVWNYGLSLLLSRPERAPGLRKALLVLGVASNLGVLGYFKYANFLVDSAASVAGAGWSIAAITLPLGISFFTFQQIAYLVDAYRAKASEPNFAHYALFVSFFPQLIAGPIIHHAEFLPQLRHASRGADIAQRFAVGATIFVIGLFKKVIVADGVAQWATPVFQAADAGITLTFLEAWGGVLAYTFQLYFDFSAYSDMAIGLGHLFGVRLPQNFNSPYRTANIIDFWQAWHMTLSRFLRDYLYIPLGGNRKGTFNRYRNLMITMLLGGLWHGAGWNFVIWGGLHGFYLVINHGWRGFWAGRRAGESLRDHPVKRILPWSLTFLAVAVAWVFFRATTFAGATSLLQSMFGFHGVQLPAVWGSALGPAAGWLNGIGISFDAPLMQHFHGPLQVGVLGILLLVVTLFPNTCELMERYRPAFAYRPGRGQAWRLGLRWRMSRAWALCIGVLGFLCLSYLHRVSEFLYFQF